MTHCPYYKNKSVFDGFNKMVKAFGGKPLTEEEFRDSDLRNLRQGSDYSAMEAAYRIYDKNGGNFLDETPDGMPSILYKTILDYFDGDETKAMNAKANVYSDEFINLFGDWINNPSNISNGLDENGEPLIDQIGLNIPKVDNTNIEAKTIIPEQKLIETCNLVDLFGSDSVHTMSNGGTVSTKTILQNILLNLFVLGSNINLAKVLSIHNIPVQFDYALSNDYLAITREEKNTGACVIYINPNAFQQVTNRYAAIAVLHEVIHAVTLNAIHNPKTKELLRFKELNNKVRNRILSLYDKNKSALGDYDSSLYALESDEEFAAVFITDPIARAEFVLLAHQADKNRSNFLNNIKNFINSIVKLFVNNTLFESTNYLLLEEYENYFMDYINNIPSINNESIPKHSEVMDLYNSISELSVTREYISDNIKALDHYEKYLDGYALRLFNREYTFKSNREERDVSSDPRYSDIIDSLKIRIHTLRTSDIDNKTRVALINATKTQISLFENANIPKYVAITSTLKYVTPQILDDIRKMRELSNANLMTSKDYMYNMHGNFGMYYTIADILSKILADRTSLNEMLREMNNTLSVDSLLTTDDIDNLIQDINNLKSAADTGVKLAEQQLKIIVAGESGILATVGKSVGSLEMGEYLASINSENPVLPNDIKWIWKHIGTADSSENESIRALSHIVKKALDAADDEALDRGIKLLKVAKKLKFGEKVTDIYEVDDKGRSTGYIVRDLNWGKFYNDYDEFMEGLNEELGLPKDNRVAPIDKDLLTKWNEARNKFLDEHCERKYKSEYYKLWNEVPLSVKESLDSYNIQINAITEGIKDKNGNFDYSKLTDEEWVELNRLWEAKALLRSDYNEYGLLRTEGDPDYEAAKALQKLYSHLYPKDSEVKKNEDAWNAERNRIIEECGGQDKYIEYIKTGKAEGFDSEKFNKWESRNTRWDYILDEDGNPIIFEKINQLLHGDKPVYGKEYDDLKEQYDSILKPYRDQRGIVNVLDIPDAVLNKLGDLSKQMNIVRKEAKSKNPRLALFLKQRAELYNEYFTYKRTDYFDSVYDELALKAYDPDTGLIDGYFLGGMLAKYGSVYFFDDDFEGNFSFNEFDFLKKSEAKDKLTYMKPSPGRGWVMKEDDGPYINKEFKRMVDSGEADENVSYIPKRSLYDNSKAFSKFRLYNKDGSENKNYSATLSELREETINMINDANKKQTNRVYTDKYLLPLITGTLYKRMKRQGSFGRRMYILWEWIKEKIGLKQAENDYSEIGSDQALDLAEDILGSLYKDTDNKSAGKYPDGRLFRILPQYYTRRLLNPSSISADLVDIVLTYYHMSCGYEQRLKIKDDCETILDFIKNQSFKSNKLTQFKEGVIKGDISNTYEMADKFLEMNLYDVKRKKSSWKMFGHTIDISKTASMVKRWTTAKNLGLNPKVAAVGFLTSMYNHIINSIVGQRYGKLDSFKSFLDVNITVGKLLLHPMKHIVGESLSDDPLIVQAEYFNIANQRERKFLGTHRPTIINNIYRNSTYGFLSTIDFMAKSCIMKSVLRNYKYVNGKFISKDDIKMAKFNLGKLKFNDLMKEYKKSPTSLNSVLKAKDKKLYVDPKYIDAWNECKDIVRNRIQKYAEAADGMPTELQRAAITLSWLGAFILIHRNYLPLMLQERFGNTVYDYDTQQYKNGQFALFINVCILIAQTGYIPGLTVGSLIGAAFGGPFGALVGAAAGSYVSHKHSGEKTLKDVWKDNFNDFSSEKAAVRTLMNRYFARQVVAEVSTYAVIAYLVNILCSYANAKLNRKKWWLQMLAYWARAFQWEAYTPYRTSDLLNNIKTPSAATSVMDTVEDAAGSTGSTITSTFLYLLFRAMYFNDQNSALFDPSNNVIYKNSLFNEVKRGNYKGMNNLEKNVIKALPVHNLYEQVLNSKAKRLYMENQLYKGDF